MFRAVCTNTESGKNAQDSVRVTTGLGGIVTLEAEDEYVRVGEETGLIWDTGTNDLASCIITGPGVNISPVPSDNNSSNPYEVSVYGESTYTLTCGVNSDTATVKVLPVIQET